MAHEFSQSAVRASGPRYRPVAPEPPVPLVRYPDAFDARYPRRWALRALRFGVGLWWLPLVAYLSQAAATLVRHALAHGPRSLANAHLALAALRASWAPALAAQRPAG